MKKKIIIFALVAVAAVLVLRGVFGTAEAPRVMTAPVKKGDISESVEATGEVFAANLVDVGAQVSGQIDKLFVKVGDKVKAGDMIAQIDSVKQKNTLAQQEAALKSYKAQLNSAKISLESATKQHTREQQLYKNKATTSESLENAKSTLASQQAKVKELQAQIEQTQIEIDTAKTNLGYTKIVAPLDGTIVSVPVEEGQTINAVQTTPTIAMIADLTKMEIKMQISEGDVTRVTKGNRVEYFILSDVNRKFNATLSSIDPGLTTLSDGTYSTSGSSSSAVYYYAKVFVENNDELLRIGMTTQNTIIINEARGALYVPSLAVKTANGESYVLVKVGEGPKGIERRVVKTGVVSSVNTQIVEGLSEGEEVVLNMRNGTSASGVRGGPRPMF